MRSPNKRHTYTILSIAIFLLSTRGMIGADQELITGLEARGRIEGTSFNPVTGKPNQSVAYLFIVDVLGERWRIRTEDERVRLGLIESAEWSEVVFDGRDMFSLVHYSDEMRQKASKKSRVEFPNDFGIAKSTEGFPLQADQIQRFLWLAFCSSPYLHSRTNLVMPSTTSPIADVVDTRAEFEWIESPQPFLKSFREYWPGVRLQITPPSITLAACPKPYNVEYLVGKYDIESTTNWNGMIVPVRFKESVNQIWGANGQATNTLERVQQGWITELTGAPKEFWKPPRTAGSSIIQEQRFSDKNGNPAKLRYSVDKPSDAAWLDRNSATFDQDVAAKKRVLPIVSPPTVTNSPWRQWVIAGSVLAILAWYIFRAAKGKATQVKETKQHKQT